MSLRDQNAPRSATNRSRREARCELRALPDSQCQRERWRFDIKTFTGHCSLGNRKRCTVRIRDRHDLTSAGAERHAAKVEVCGTYAEAYKRHTS